MYIITRVDGLLHRPYCVSDGVIQVHAMTEELALMLYRVQRRVYEKMGLLEKDSDMSQSTLQHYLQPLPPALPAPHIAGLLPAPSVVLLPKPVPQAVATVGAYHLRRGTQWTNRAYTVVGTGMVNGKPTVKLEIGSKGISMVYQCFVDSSNIKPVAERGDVKKAA